MTGFKGKLFSSNLHWKRQVTPPYGGGAPSSLLDINSFQDVLTREWWCMINLKLSTPEYLERTDTVVAKPASLTLIERQTVIVLWKPIF